MKKNTNKSKIIMIVGGSTLIILLLLSALFFVNKSDETPAKDSIRGESIADVDGAITAAEDFLNNALSNPDNLSLDERLERVGEKDFTVLHEDFKNTIHFPNNFTDDDRVMVYQGILTIADMSDSDKDGVVEVHEAYLNAISFYSETGLAYIPISLFAGQDTVYSFEFALIGEDWRFIPVSFYNSLRYVIGSQLINDESVNE